MRGRIFDPLKASLKGRLLNVTFRCLPDTVANLNRLVGAGTTHSFTRDGYYNDSRPTPAVLEQDP